MARAVALASLRRRRGFMVIADDLSRSPSSLACSADVDTLAIPINSKTLRGSFRRAMSSLQPPAAGMRPTPASTRPHIEFGLRLDAGSVEDQFAAAAEGALVRRDNHWFGGVFDRHGGLLEAVDGGVEVVPLLILGGEQDHDKICTDAKVLSLVADEQGGEVFLQLLEGGVDHGDCVFTEGVHLGVKLEAETAVAGVVERGARVGEDVCRFGGDRRGRRTIAEDLTELEGAILVSVAPLHGVIDIFWRMSDLG